MNTFNWVILEIRHGDAHFYKLLSQVGISMDDWIINSGIVAIDTTDKGILVRGVTGSAYVCDFDTEGLSPCTDNKLSFWQESIPEGTARVIKYKDIDTSLFLKTAC